MTLPVRMPLKVTVNTTGSPSLAVASAMDRVGSGGGGGGGGASSSLMVPVAVAVVMGTPALALSRVTVKVSFGSTSPSSIVDTEIVSELPGGVNVRVPDLPE